MVVDGPAGLSDATRAVMLLADVVLPLFNRPGLICGRLWWCCG